MIFPNSASKVTFSWISWYHQQEETPNSHYNHSNQDETATRIYVPHKTNKCRGSDAPGSLTQKIKSPETWIVIPQTPGHTTNQLLST